jgi:tRNA(fMet)-specific endonuclease VapC
VTDDAILGTSAAVAHLRGVAVVGARLRAKLAAQETVYFPLTAWGELLYGAYHYGQSARELANLAAFAPGTVRLLPTDRTADGYARLNQALAAAGTPLPENDIWIAAHALEQALSLITRDAHFKRVPGLTILDWS